MNCLCGDQTLALNEIKTERKARQWRRRCNVMTAVARGPKGGLKGRRLDMVGRSGPSKAGAPKATRGPTGTATVTMAMMTTMAATMQYDDDGGEGAKGGGIPQVGA